ncbi:undecaprenyl-diphosphate phosphatase [Streptacidiphilus jiangxiensis]|uniref:Undecaprenyl-diphosphatase n=1 Tax=Streptacidiphilus jiangxiensis TaxID=235985 RepID=A0A1H7JYP2_STRJI|nr:undecaprenyl-diphosphate phosphatase [Streptacidiphilus jiangxiensis]SEK79811.1 undecaprenyl-diphosphatase [Streptacidiphilus jiangxiensis]
MSVLTYPEAIGVGLLQGVTELFPVSSLGHSILIPALLGKPFSDDLNVAGDKSPYLSVLIGLHLATALALVVYFRKDWARIIQGLYSSIRERRIETVNQRLAWLLIVATIPVGVAGIALDKFFREHLGKPEVAAFFLMLNGFVLFTAERLKRGGTGRRRAGDGTGPGDENVHPDVLSDRRIVKLGWGSALFVGAAQIAALLPGISRSGVTMSAGIFKGLRHEDSARFAFLLATPAIGGAALLKMPGLLGSEGAGIHGQLLAGSIAAFVAGYVAVRFLDKYFETKTLTPFAIYCFLAGAGSLVYLSM